MAIFSIEPKTSKITGGVTIDITGNNFLKPKYEIVPSISNVINTSTNLASLEDNTAGIKLNITENLSQRSSFRLDRLMPSAFKMLLDFSILPLSLPLIKNAKLLGFELISEDNTSKKIRLYFNYSELKGYQLVLEEKLGTSLISRVEESINPNSVEKLGIHISGGQLHGSVVIDSTEIFLLKLKTQDSSAYRLEVFSETPENGVALNSSVLVKNLCALSAVSFGGYPTRIVSFESTKIRTITIPGEILLGDLIVMSADLTIQKKIDNVRYVLGAGAGKVKKDYDTIQAIYAQYVNPSREDLFKNQEGFQWDEGYLLPENQKNKELSVPTLWDPTTGNIPNLFFESGVGSDNALSVNGIYKNKQNDQESWYAKLNHGTYYIENVPYYLFSDESIIEYLSEQKTEDGRSYHNLLYYPKIGIPVAAFSMKEDPDTKVTLQKKKILKKASFTGKIVNGVELNTENPSNIDSNQDEFIVKLNKNNKMENWKIPITTDLIAGSYFFQLPSVPLKEFNMIFSRKDIFKKQKTKANRYGEASYGSFLFGEGVEEIGDYAVDYQTGEVEVSLAYPYKDLGSISYVFDYPAVIEFNHDYTSDKGSRITDPNFSDLGTLDNLGFSSGNPLQSFRLSDFPIIDYSSIQLLDTKNFSIFLYDEYDNSFDSDWRRVKSISGYGPTDKVYEVDPALGLIKFGNNITGQIPGKYLRVLAGYKPTLKIQFEPEESNNLWTAKSIDLNLTKQNMNAGFLYLDRKKIIPSQIVAEFASKAINVFETAEISAVVLTQDDELVSGTKINFEFINGAGAFRDKALVTNSDGYVSTTYIPSSRLEDMGMRVDLYEAGLSISTAGSSLENNYGTKGGFPYYSLKLSETIQGDLANILIFKILDDNDNFLPYNSITRKGGRLVLLYKDGAPVRGEYLAGSIIGFSEQLPQPFDPYAPNYEPSLRGFYVVAKKNIEARAFVDIDGARVYSNIVSLTCEYSPIQTGTWTLPTPPLSYERSQINTATYIDINV